MPSLEQHVIESLTLTGKPWREVHQWLDELAGKPPWGMQHRGFRHHLAGIEYVRQRWGEAAAKAARQHVISDLRMEGWTEEDEFPRDPEHYQEVRFPVLVNGKWQPGGFMF